MADYDARFLATAGRLLAPKSKGGKGQVVTLHQPATDGVFDPATDTTTPGTDEADHEGSGVEENYSAFSVAGGVVAAGDVKFLLSALKVDGTLMPKPEADRDTLIRADGEWAIKKVDPLMPAGMAIMFTLQLRRS